MRRKSVAKRKRAACANAPSFSGIPHLLDEHNATVFDSESDNDDCTHNYYQPEPETEPETLDLMDRSICISCNSKGEEGVLVCSESGCPVTIHANCIGSEPKFDESGNFYCPYCWYKRAVDTCQKLREKAMIAKKTLSDFLNDGRPNARADSGATPCTERVNPVRDVSGTRGFEREEESKDEENESKDEGNKSKDEGKEGKDEGNESEDEGMVPGTCSSVSETNDSDYEIISRKKRKDPKKVSSVGKPLLQQHHNTRVKVAHEVSEEVTSPRNFRQPRRSSMQVTRQTSLTARRRRLHWTAEEEKALKEGVLKFSMENQKMPWRKILEFGCRVFDKTRTPGDLKDKWKNITNKEGCKL